MRRLVYPPLSLSVLLAAVLLAGCARGVETKFGSVPRDVESRPAPPQRPVREQYAAAHTLWDVDLRELLSRIPGDRHRVEPAFDRLRGDLALMRALLDGEDRKVADSLLLQLDELKPTILRAKNRVVVERRLDPIAVEVNNRLSPQEVRPGDERR